MQVLPMNPDQDFQQLALAELRAIREGMTGFGYGLAAVENGMGRVENRIGWVENRIGWVENRMGRVQNQMAELRGEVADLGEQVENLHDQIMDLRASVGAKLHTLSGFLVLQDRTLVKLEEWLTQLSARMSVLEDRYNGGGGNGGNE